MQEEHGDAEKEGTHLTKVCGPFSLFVFLLAFLTIVHSSLGMRDGRRSIQKSVLGVELISKRMWVVITSFVHHVHTNSAGCAWTNIQ
jgi:hypothetical protein